MGFPLSQLKEKKYGGRDLTFSRNKILKQIVTKTFLSNLKTLISQKHPTLLVLNQRENYGIDKIIDINKFSNLNKPYRTTACVKRFCVNLKTILNNRKETILLKSFLKSPELRQA